jgi:hypothetical protein
MISRKGAKDAKYAKFMICVLAYFASLREILSGAGLAAAAVD